MPQQMLVLIGAPPAAGVPSLTDAHVSAALAALADAGAATAAPAWLAPGECCEIGFDGVTLTDGRAAVQSRLADAPLDVCAVPAADRRKMLLVADMDSTIVQAETLDELAALAGVGDRVKAITERAMRGELDFAGALRERVALLKGKPAALRHDTLGKMDLMPGALALVRTMRAHGAVTCLASGGFTWFTSRIRDQVGFHSDAANELGVDGEVFTGTVGEPVFDRASKKATLLRLAAEHGLAPALTLAVGDGANDLDMIEAAGLGVAFRAKPVVAAAAAASVRHGDLTGLLFLQGYRRDQFVTELQQ